MKRETRLLKNTAIIGFGLLCTKGVSFLLLPLYTYLLSTSDYGTVDLVFTLVSLIAYTLTLQFEQGVLRFLIDCRNDKEEQKKYISTTLLFITLVTAVFIIGLVIVCAVINYKYTFFLAANIVVTTFLSLLCQIVRGLDKTVTFSFASFISIFSQVLLNVVFITVFKWNIGGMLSALFIGKTIGIVYIIIRCKIPSFVRIKYFDKTALKELLKYSLPMVPNTLCWWIVNLSDRLIITSFLGAGANGIYAVANKFPTIFTSFAKVFQMSWTENAAESNNSEDRDNYFSKIMNQSVSIIVCICACILAALPLVFRFLVNSKYSESYINILILLIAAIFSSWSSLYVSLFGALKYTKTIIFTTVFAAVVNVAVNFIFINKIGLIAASLSTLAAYLLITVLSHILISKKAHIKYKFSDMLIAFSALGVCAASYCIKNIWLSLVITVLVGALTVFKNKNIIIPIFNKTVSPVISKIKK